MVINFSVRPEQYDKILEVTHVDRSSRIQTVHRLQNPLFHELITTFYEITGLPLVLNTSLNTRGRPMATTPQDALAVLYTSGLDALVLQDCIVAKQLEHPDVRQTEFPDD
jgi:carbamoyltransferase